MKRGYLLVFLGLVLLALLLVKIYRYDTLDKTADMHRYVDRWTNTEWVKVTTPLGTDRYAAKYYSKGKSTAVSADNVISELSKMRRIDIGLTAAWYALIAGAIMLTIYVLKGRHISITTQSNKH